MGNVPTCAIRLASIVIFKTQTAGYVGSRGVHLPLNWGNFDMVPPSLVTVAPDGHLLFPTTRPVPVINPKFGSIGTTQWQGWSVYRSLQVNLTQQVRYGLTLQGAYSWSKSIDIGAIEYASNELQNSMDDPWSSNPNLNRGVSDFNTPHRLSVNLVWDAPSLHSGIVVSRFLLSGWELSGIFTAQSGAPNTVVLPIDQAGTGALVSGGAGQFVSQRPDFKAGPGCRSPNAVNPGDPSTYYNLQCFSFPKLGELGNLGRNTLRGPGLENVDFSLFKNHNLLGEKLKVQFRAEFFNLFNRPNFGTQRVTPFNNLGQTVPAAAAILPPTATTSRQIQFGMKFVW